MMKLTELLMMRKRCWMAVRLNIQLGWEGSMPRLQHRLVLLLTADWEEDVWSALVFNTCSYPVGLKIYLRQLADQEGDHYGEQHLDQGHIRTGGPHPAGIKDHISIRIGMELITFFVMVFMFSGRYLDLKKKFWPPFVLPYGEVYLHVKEDQAK
jgi:hypothetical protein